MLNSTDRTRGNGYSPGMQASVIAEATMLSTATKTNASEESASNQVWVGFVCKGCGAPLALHRSNNGSRPGERSTRGWRVQCTSCGVPDFYEPGSAMVRISAS